MLEFEYLQCEQEGCEAVYKMWMTESLAQYWILISLFYAYICGVLMPLTCAADLWLVHAIGAHEGCSPVRWLLTILVGPFVTLCSCLAQAIFFGAAGDLLKNGCSALPLLELLFLLTGSALLWKVAFFDSDSPRKLSTRSCVRCSP